MKASIVFVFSAIILLHGVSSASADALEETCKKVKTTSYEFCITTLQVDPASHTANKTELIRIALKLTNTNFTNNIDKLKELSKSKDLSPQVRIAVGYCVHLYNDEVLDTLEMARESLRDNKLDEVRECLSSAATDVDECEESIKDAGDESVFLKENDLTYSLCFLGHGLTEVDT